MVLFSGALAIKQKEITNLLLPTTKDSTCAYLIPSMYAPYRNNLQCGRFMKKIFALLALSGISGTCFSQTFVLTDVDHNIEKGNWQLPLNSIPALAKRKIRITQTVLHGGRQEGSKIITITDPTGLTIVLSPTRGMGILHVSSGQIQLGWNSPVKEVVNPNTINLDSNQGLGWLEGFNEMMVRCGFEWAGHPVVDNGRLYTLHGRAENLPASNVEIEVDNNAPYAITVRGLVKEVAFKKTNLQGWTALRYVPGQQSFEIHDKLLNASDYPQNYELIYHSNFSTPLLEEGSHFVSATKNVAPFNDYAKDGLKSWEVYKGPTLNFNEMVFNVYPYSRQDGSTEVALVNRANDKGVSIRFNTNQLPVLSLWKNTDTVNQGYVTGIEPGTNFSYPVTIERAQGRIKTLAPGKHVHFDLTYTVLDSATQVKQAEERIQSIKAGRTTTLIDQPTAKE